MNSIKPSVGPGEAARRLGVSTKALRLYEQRGLIRPARTEAGWRQYGPKDIEAAYEIVALRKLGLSLGQVERVLNGDVDDLKTALSAHADCLEQQIRNLQNSRATVAQFNSEVSAGRYKVATGLTRFIVNDALPIETLNLPWPWGGEQFEVRPPRSISFITGPLGSGKTRFAKALAKALPDAAFLGLEGRSDDCDKALQEEQRDSSLRLHIDRALNWLIEEGAVSSNALISLLAALEADAPAMLVVDLIEQNLDEATQEALINYLRRRGPRARPLFVMTRSTAILDLDSMQPDEDIIYCPANHSPPMYVSPYAGATGFEAVSLCLATPTTRARLTRGCPA